MHARTVRACRWLWHASALPQPLHKLPPVRHAGRQAGAEGCPARAVTAGLDSTSRPDLAISALAPPPCALRGLRGPALCRYEFQVTGPLLVVVPQAMLDFWEGDWHFWAGQGPQPSAAGRAQGQGQGGNMVVYTGTAVARTLLHEQELWLSPSSLDRKGAMGRGREDCPAKVRCRAACLTARPCCAVLWRAVSCGCCCTEEACMRVEGRTAGVCVCVGGDVHGWVGEGGHR